MSSFHLWLIQHVTVFLHFDRDFYTVNENLPQYQKFMKPYKELQKKVDYLVNNGKIGKATGESIKLRNGVKID